MADFINTLNNISRSDTYTKAQLQQVSSGVDLNNDQVLKQFTLLVKEAIDNNDERLALLGRYVLEDILLEQQQSSLKQSTQIYNSYLELIAMLKFVNLSIRGIPEISRLIKENLVDAFKAGIKIRQKFQEVLDSFDDFLVEGEVAEAITKAMLSCAQKLGSFALLAEQNKRIPQTLGNWLNDYIQFGLSSGEHRTGSIARIQYFKVNQNAKQLSEEDRKLLLEVFRIYDWLRYGGDEEKSLELDEIFTEPTNYIKSEKFELPEEVVSPPPSGAQARPQPPSVPRRSFAGPVAPQVVNIQDILHKRDLSEEKVGGLKFGNGQAKSNLPPSKKQPEQTAMPNQEKSAQILPTSPPPVSLDKSRLVDKKLEELKKKLNKS